MARPKEYDVDPAAASLTGFASNITGAGPWTMTTTDTPDGLAHVVSIRNDDTTSYVGQTFTCEGIDQNGDAISEAVTGPGNAATVESAGYFKTLNTVTASGAGISTDTFDVGYVDEVATATCPINFYGEIAATVSVDISGTINFTVQETFDDALGGGTIVWVAISALSGKTADTTAQASIHATAVRVIVNSYSAGAELQMRIIQSHNN